MRSLLGVAVGTALALLTLQPFTGSERIAQDPHKGWVDYDADDLTQVERLKERPGNYRILSTIADFFEGIYSVRPDYSRCAYPFQLNSVTYANWNELQKKFDAQAKDGARPKNKLRQYNVQIRSLTVHSASGFSETAEFKKLHQSEQKRFGEVRKRHPGRAILALVRADLESLQSPKVEGGEEPFIFYLSPAQGRWRVAWFEHP